MQRCMMAKSENIAPFVYIDTAKFYQLRITALIQSTLSKSDTFGAGTKCPSKRDVCLIESQIKGVKKGRDQL